MRFYYVDEDYIQHLKRTDRRIPNMIYKHDRLKFVCGPVMEVNGISYYAPVSHNAKKYQTSMLIYNGKEAVASIRMAYMFPADKAMLHRVDIKALQQTRPKYASFLESEYRFIKKQRKAVKTKAESVYKISQNKDHFLHKSVCNFKALEKAFLTYQCRHYGGQSVIIGYREENTVTQESAVTQEDLEKE